MSLDNLIKKLTTGADLEKSASAAEEPVTATKHDGKTLEELLTKSASEQSENSKTKEENSEMNKQAQAQANALAAQILDVLEKAASEKQANEVITGTDIMVAEDDAKIKPTPVEGNTVTGTLRDLILQGVANGAVTENAADEVGPKEGDAEGAVAAKAVTNGPAAAAPAAGTTAQNPSSEEVEKAAAVSELVARGHDFDNAVAMVKWAEERMAIETIEMAKVASVNALVENGVSLTDAVNLVEASAAHLGL